MNECSQSVGKGTIMYKCRVSPAGHAGPCAAPELGRSIVEREAWLSQQQPAPVPEPAPAPGPHPNFVAAIEAIEVDMHNAVTPSDMVTPPSPSNGAPIGAVQLGSFTDFEASAKELMNREDLTPALNNWLTGTAAQIALNHLWRQANDAFEAGCVSITMTKAELEKFIPERLRPT